MAYLPMPQPLPYPESEGFWKGCKKHTLLFQKCTDCETYRHMPISFSIFKILNSPAKIPEYKDSFPREELARKSNALSDKINDVIITSTPQKFVSDPEFEF